MPDSGERRIGSGERRVTSTRDDMDRESRQIREIIALNDRRYEERFKAAQLAVDAALAAQKEAVGKAEAAYEKRFEGVNEFRAQLGDQQRTLMPRAECDLRFHAAEARLDTIEKAGAERSGVKVGAKENMGFVVGSVGILIALLTLALRFIGP